MAKRQSKPKLTPAERMLVSKRKLIARLKADIDDVQVRADWHIGKIKARIRIAEALADALERGTLKP